MSQGTAAQLNPPLSHSCFSKTELLRGVAVCKFEVQPFVSPAFSIWITQKVAAASELWTLALTPPAEGWDIDASRGVSRCSLHQAAGDGIDKTHRQMICTANSSAEWGLFWLMNIELPLSNSKLNPALQTSIFGRGWAADCWWIHQFLSGWWVFSKPLVTQQLVRLFLLVSQFLIFFWKLRVFTQCWMLFCSCSRGILYMTISRFGKNWCHKFVYAAVLKFSSICGTSSKGHICLRNIVTVAWNGNFNAWKISFWFIFISADENYYDVSSRA